MKTKIQWFARGGGIAKMGPYPSQVKASQALITVDGVPIEGAFVWPERVPVKPAKGRCSVRTS